jgi:hypothetical protein
MRDPSVSEYVAGTELFRGGVDSFRGVLSFPSLVFLRGSVRAFQNHAGCVEVSGPTCHLRRLVLFSSGEFH